MSAWQKIETCDLENASGLISPGVLLWNGKRVTIGWYCDEDGWQDGNDAPDYCDNTLKPQPTHFMPLPEGPK